MRARSLLLVLLAALAAALPAAAAEERELLPGVTYLRESRTVGGKRVVFHVVTAPRPGGLYRLVPVLGHGTVTGRERVTDMQRRLADRATAVGVNGDYYNVAEGFPSGIVMRDGALHGRPNPGRSALGIGLDGTLRLGVVGFAGSWETGDGRRRALAHVNRPLEGRGTALFTPAWGAETPRRRNAVEVVLAGFPPATPDTALAGQVVAVARGGGTAIPPGGAVLQAAGPPGRELETVAQPGALLVVRLTLRPWWEGVADAIGGGPALVRDGRVALPTSETFSAAQLRPRHPRTAAGQLADGRIVLVAVDGRSAESRGIGLTALAWELVRLGAVTAIAFDGGGGTTMAFDGRVLNRPSDGAERAASNALMLLYEGVYAPAPRHPVLSPNGDGVAETQRLAFRVVRPSRVTVRLLAGRRTIAREERERAPGTYPVELDAGTLREGLWRLVVSAVDNRGRRSTAERRFRVDTTLGFLALGKKRVKLHARRGGRVGISFRTSRRSRLAVTVEDGRGRVVRTLVGGVRRPGGAHRLSWNGRDDRGRVVRSGRYVVRVAAERPFGEVELRRPVVVRRSGPRR